MTWASVSSTKRLAWEHHYWHTFLPTYDYNEIDMPLKKHQLDCSIAPSRLRLVIAWMS